MTVEEFSNEFDNLIDSYRRFKNFDDKENLDSLEFNEYEKSVFLTKAQEELVISLYNGKNLMGDSFESSEEMRRYLSSLVKTSTIKDKQEEKTGISENSVFFKLPSDLMFITYESVSFNDDALGCKYDKYTDVIPVSLDDYLNIKKNPFKGPNKRRALRLDIEDDTVEIISKYNIDEYLVRYVSKPTPIVLINLPNNLTVGGQNKISECKLNEALHRSILDRAVRIALASKSIESK